MLAHRILAESVGEEIRILYVAMTRAVNKLIMVANVTNMCVNLISYPFYSNS